MNAACLCFLMTTTILCLQRLRQAEAQTSTRNLRRGEISRQATRPFRSQQQRPRIGNVHGSENLPYLSNERVLSGYEDLDEVPGFCMDMPGSVHIPDEFSFTCYYLFPEKYTPGGITCGEVSDFVAAFPDHRKELCSYPPVANRCRGTCEYCRPPSVLTASGEPVTIEVNRRVIRNCTNQDGFVSTEASMEDGWYQTVFGPETTCLDFRLHFLKFDRDRKRDRKWLCEDLSLHDSCRNECAEECDRQQNVSPVLVTLQPGQNYLSGESGTWFAHSIGKQATCDEVDGFLQAASSGYRSFVCFTLNVRRTCNYISCS